MIRFTSRLFKNTAALVGRQMEMTKLQELYNNRSDHELDITQEDLEKVRDLTAGQIQMSNLQKYYNDPFGYELEISLKNNSSPKP